MTLRDSHDSTSIFTAKLKMTKIPNLRFVIKLGVFQGKRMTDHLEKNTLEQFETNKCQVRGGKEAIDLAVGVNFRSLFQEH